MDMKIFGKNHVFEEIIHRRPIDALPENSTLHLLYENSRTVENYMKKA